MSPLITSIGLPLQDQDQLFPSFFEHVRVFATCGNKDRLYMLLTAFTTRVQYSSIVQLNSAEHVYMKY